MPSSSYAKLISQKWKTGRDVCDVRNVVSSQIKEARKSNREAALNKHRNIDFEKEERKRTAEEEKLQRLKLYKLEKQKKMEEQKKKQRPPFCNIVKSRHTGGTPFRETAVAKAQPLRKIVLSTVINTKFQTQYNNSTTSSTSSTPPRLRSLRNKQPLRQIPPVKNTAPVSSLPQTTALATRSRTKSKPPPKPNVDKLKKTESNKEEKENKSRPQRREQIVKQIVPEVKKNVKVVKATKVTDRKPKNDTKPVNNVGKKINGAITALERLNIQSSTTTGTMATRRVTRQMSKIEHIQLPAPVVTKPKITKKVESKTKPIVVKEEIPTAAKEENFIPEGVGEDDKKDLDEQKRGVDFHRKRLQNEIDMLTNKADTWSRRHNDNIPEHIKDEIFAVVGQTRLLLAEKFRKFSNLIDKCETDTETSELRVTLDDLEGYWDVMYQQVEQLIRKYASLCELESNRWLEKLPMASNNKTKQVIPGRRLKKPVASKFKEFLKQQQKPATRSSTSEDNTSPKPAVSIGDSVPDILKTPIITPSQRRVATEKRRSSGLIILKQRHLMKEISSPHRK